MGRGRRAAALALAAACCACGFTPAGAEPDVGAAAASVVEKTDALRRSQGLGAVEAETRLARAAADFAAWMASTDRYGHEADGRTPAARSQAQGYAHCAVGENIAWRYSSAGFTTAALAAGFFDGWVDSPPHRRNLLDPAYTQTGVGIARSAASGRYYAVQLFGRPLSMRLSFAVANESSTEFDYAVDGRGWRLAPSTTRSHSVCGDGLLMLPGAAAARRADAGARYAVRRAGGRWQVAVDAR